MKFTNYIIGTIIATTGIVIGYIDYLVIRTLYELSSWVAGLLNAPQALSVILTLLLSWIFLGLILVIFIIAIFLIIWGVHIILNNFFFFIQI